MADCESAPQEFHLSDFIRAAFISCDGFITLDLWLSRSIIVPTACHRHISSNLILIIIISRSAICVLAWLLKWLMHPHNNRNVFDEWLIQLYERKSFHKLQLVRGILFGVLFKIFQKLFSCGYYRLINCWYCFIFLLCNFSVCKVFWIVFQKSFFR